MKSKKITKRIIEDNSIFDELATEWWKPDGSFRALHAFNFVRIKFIKDTLKKKSINSIRNLKILDIGCGGGILCEPLARLGAKVTGIDENKKAIEAAKEHSKKNKLKINYKALSYDEIKLNEKFDVILSMEVLEHIDDIGILISNSKKLLKKNGIFLGSTINKTLSSYLLAIVFAENILRLVPKKTHIWSKFIKTNRIKKELILNNFTNINFQGVIYNPINKQWKTIKDCSVNYMFASELNE
ncbi:MAG: bifunctional 2-polyprenyl-6-hydroxyphenol methylase/3-demethylubiquinol 3-O-methyltransferase UbiG [Alphaproteobacteria bacterium]|tara:strand:+ start:2522 stop:3247 length:726 start_codon:yes stop_codon:yes gene_type:complete